MNVRPYQAQDFGPVTRLWHDVFHEAFPFLQGSYPRERFERYFRRVLLPRDAIWVSAEPSHILGFISLQGSYISHLYVDPIRRRQGVGRSLVERAKRSSPSGLSVHTFTLNHSGLRFYERLGFSAGALLQGQRSEEEQVELRWSNSP